MNAGTKKGTLNRYPLNPPGGDNFLGESQSRLYPHMHAKLGRDPTFVSKKRSLKFISRFGFPIVPMDSSHCIKKTGVTMAKLTGMQFIRHRTCAWDLCIPPPSNSQIPNRIPNRK